MPFAIGTSCVNMLADWVTVCCVKNAQLVELWSNPCFFAHTVHLLVRLREPINGSNGSYCLVTRVMLSQKELKRKMA